MNPHVSASDYSMDLSDAAAYIESLTGKRLPSANMYRWIRHGVGGVRLEARKLGGRYYTGRRAVDAFLEATDRPVRQSRDTRPVLTRGLQSRVNGSIARSNNGEHHAVPRQASATHERSVEYLKSKLGFSLLLIS